MGWKLGFEFEYIDDDDVSPITMVLQAHEELGKGWDVTIDNSANEDEDPTMTQGLELRSPPLIKKEAMKALMVGLKWVREHGRTGRWCGLHMHASHDGIDINTVDPLVLALQHDDEMANRLFPHPTRDRHYCRLLSDIVRDARIEDEPCDINLVRRWLSVGMEGRMVAIAFSKHRPKRFEIRLPGGIDYEHRDDDIIRYLQSTLRVIRLAHRPSHDVLTRTMKRWSMMRL